MKYNRRGLLLILKLMPDLKDYKKTNGIGSVFSFIDACCIDVGSNL